MGRKSAKMVRKDHVVLHTNGREVKVLGARPFVHETYGDMIEISLADGTVWHRTPDAKINVVRTR